MINVFTTLSAVILLSGTVTADASNLPQGVHVEKTGAGQYLMAEGQRSLYWNEKEVAAGEVTCLEECLETWIPLQAPSDVQGDEQWTVIQRPDNILQWSYQGKPLYAYVKDTFPKARLGDGLARSWHVVYEPRTVPAGMSIEDTLLGLVLTEHHGRTLYTRTSSVDSGSQDRTVNLDHWEPFEAPWLALDQGEWSIQWSSNGARQWAYKGQPLFTYTKDNDPQDVYGYGLNGVWSAVILEPAPALPSWMTVQHIDYGLAYANEQGLTVYAPVDTEAIKKAQTCTEKCMQEYWRPILAEPGEMSVGDWVIHENEHGQQQWSYKGRFLYTHTRDTKPGDITGNGIGVGYRIGDGFRFIPIETGFRRDRG